MLLRTCITACARVRFAVSQSFTRCLRGRGFHLQAGFKELIDLVCCQSHLTVTSVTSVDMTKGVLPTTLIFTLRQRTR